MNIPEEGKYGADTAGTDELMKAVERVFSSSPEKMVISSPRSSDSQYDKIVVSRRMIRGQLIYQAEQFTKTQVFHKNMDEDETRRFTVSLLRENFRQLNSFSDTVEYNLRISKKGKVLMGKHIVRTDKTESGSGRETGKKERAGKIPMRSGIEYHGKTTPERFAHNRKKNRLIEEGTIVPPLVDMGIFTKEGKIVRSMEDKFRQINRFLEIVNDAVESCGFQEIRIVDFGCGKAYLTFILYYYLTYVKKIRAYMTGLDLKADVIRKCRDAARRYGYENLNFEIGDISVYESDKPVDMVITLHACDTATDFALYHAVQWNSRVILFRSLLSA